MLESQQTIAPEARTQTEKDLDKHKNAIKEAPIYILNPDNAMIKVLRVFFGLCALPSVILNLLVISFGFLESL
jgi:hypothetical protein